MCLLCAHILDYVPTAVCQCDWMRANAPSLFDLNKSDTEAESDVEYEAEYID